MCILLEEMGFEIEASHHEVARGQHEIDFKYDEALTTADNVITFKEVVKTTAQRHGLHATFMPKPIFGIAGSGMHINMSPLPRRQERLLRRDGPLRPERDGLPLHRRRHAPRRLPCRGDQPARQLL